MPQITSTCCSVAYDLQVLYKFYDESFYCNVIILDAVVLLQNQIFRDKKQNFVGICTTLTIISFFPVLCLIPFVSNTTFSTSLSSQVCVFTACYRLKVPGRKLWRQGKCHDIFKFYVAFYMCWVKVSFCQVCFKLNKD